MTTYRNVLNGVTAFVNKDKNGKTFITVCFLGLQFNCFEYTKKESYASEYERQEGKA